jgi:histidinol-phosphate/aromatic aminotransferase/cobyric acid decarboxylase-like protein
VTAVPVRTAAIPPAGPHGGDAAALAAALGCGPDEILDLSLSLNPDAPDVAALAAAHLGALRRYPDPRAATEAMAGALGTTPDRVLLTNGGSEAIALVCAALGRAAVATPGEFSLYARHLTEAVDPASDPTAPRVRSNPHNPTGRLAGATERAAVWDEAFYPLAAGAWSRGDPDAVVVGSLTKVFACPGLRVGYIAAPDAATVERLTARQPRWALNALAAALVPALLARADLGAWQQATAERRAALTRALPGVAPSDANYVLVEVAPGGAAARERLARHGALVRDCTSFGLPGHVRVAVPDDAGLRRLVAAWEQAGIS